MRVGTILCLVGFPVVYVSGPPGFAWCGADAARSFWWNALSDWSLSVSLLCLIAPMLSWSVYEIRLDRTARVLMLLPVIATGLYAVALPVVYAFSGKTISCLLFPA